MDRIGTLPSIDSLLCFVAAARRLSFRRAAGEVGITPTAFSQRIRGLEEQLGQALFHRTTRKVELSDAGRALIPIAEQAIDRARLCTFVADGNTGTVSFKLGTRYEIGISWVTPAVIELKTRMPHLRPDLVFGSSEETLRRLGEGSIDCLISSAPVTHSDWDSVKLHTETYSLFGRADLLERVPLDEPGAAANHTLVDAEESLPLARYLIRNGPAMPFRSYIYAGALGAMMVFVLAGEGVAVLPDYAAEPYVKSGILARAMTRETIHSDAYRLMYRKAHPLAEQFKELAAFLQERPLV